MGSPDITVPGKLRTLVPGLLSAEWLWGRGSLPPQTAAPSRMPGPGQARPPDRRPLLLSRSPPGAGPSPLKAAPAHANSYRAPADERVGVRVAHEGPQLG